MMESNGFRSLGLLAVAGLLALGGLAWWMGRPDAPRPEAALAGDGQAGSVPVPAREAVPAGAGISLDISRVGPGGDAVVAGRALPGTEVTLHAGGQEIGRAQADQRGEWLITPAMPLPPGAHSLSLGGRAPSGEALPGGDAVVVVVVVPERQPAAEAAPPVALLLPAQGAPARLLQGGKAGREARLGLDVVDYDEAGGLRFSGTAPPGSRVRVYIDEAHAGDAVAGGDGRWALQPPGAVSPGQHRLRLDQLAEGGNRVAARRELPFHREAQGGPAQAGQVVVQPGHSLWRIARATYGQGTRYSVIYRANREQIREPGRIYPGQVFALPPAR